MNKDTKPTDAGGLPVCRVYSTKYKSPCAGCGKHMELHELTTRKNEEYYCQTCSGLDGLELLPSGNSGLTTLTLRFMAENSLSIGALGSNARNS